MSRIFRFAFVRFTLLSVVVPSRADEIDTYIAEQLEKQNVPGLSLAVVQNGKLTKAKGYGLANVELNVPATEDTVYQWASVTKQFTSAAILMLADDGKLALDDLISRYYTNAPATWRDCRSPTSPTNSHRRSNASAWTCRLLACAATKWSPARARVSTPSS